MKKRIVITLIFIFLLLLIWLIGSGFIKRSDVVLIDYFLSEDGEEITLELAVETSAGHVRDFLNDTSESQIMELQFYSAFGGLNGSIGAKSQFTIPLNPDCHQIYFYTDDGFDLVLEKDMKTGDWYRP